MASRTLALSAKKAPRGNTNLVAQGAKFGVVGISNTIIDFTLYNLFAILLNVPLSSVYIVKFFSGSIAMINSFYWNRRWVFKSRARIDQAGVRFLIATLVSVYLIQPQVVRLFSATSTGLRFGNFWYDFANTLTLVQRFPHLLTQVFVIKTVAFAMGVLCSAVWNFTLYKLWAFKK